MKNTKNLTEMDKASLINGDITTFGSFAEIGAGQEVARWFFKAGSSSNTIAKTMSAYDTTFSDEIYGREKSNRYVCESRLIKMLNHEYQLMEDRLGKKRGPQTRFFVFANTVATSNNKIAKGHGWLGIKFQHKPLSKPSEIVIHINLNDPHTNLQQETVGRVGINLVYASLYFYETPKRMLESMADNLSTSNVEIDMIRCTGEAFLDVDNRLLSLELAKLGLSKLILFGPQGKVCQPSDMLYKKNVLIQRGDFRPITNTQVEIQNKVADVFLKDHKVRKEDAISVMEMTMSDLKETVKLEASDFLARTNILSKLGFNVMVSNYKSISDLGYRMQKERAKLYAFILSDRRVGRMFANDSDRGLMYRIGKFLGSSGYVYMYNTGIKFEVSQKKLFDYLVSVKQITFLENLNVPKDQDIISKIRSNDSSWTKHVPSEVVGIIKDNSYFKN